jgi:hypothetical protein
MQGIYNMYLKQTVFLGCIVLQMYLQFMLHVMLLRT